MKPFDLPDNLFDIMHADLCRPVEVREVYISRLIEDDDRNEHFDLLPKNMDLYGSVVSTLSAKATLDDEHDEHVDRLEPERRDTAIEPGTGTLTIGG